MRYYEASNPSPVVARELLEAALEVPPDTLLELIVWFRHRPAGEIARELQQLWMPLVEPLAGEVRAIHRSVRPAKSMTPFEEMSYVESLAKTGDPLPPAERQKLRGLHREVERLTDSMNAEINRRVKNAVALEHEAMELHVTSLGGQVMRKIYSQSGFVVRLPAARLAEIASDPRVAHVMVVPPTELLLDKQATSLGVDTSFWNDQIFGGVWDVGVIDSGVQQSHPALNHLNFVTIPGMGTEDLSSIGHGTSVAGILASDPLNPVILYPPSPLIRGLAYGLHSMLIGNCAARAAPHRTWPRG